MTLEELEAVATEHAKDKGWVLSDKAEEILDAIMENDGCCPCSMRPVPCPCPSSEEDVEEEGSCNCGLFEKG